ncbi:MAG: bifunctional (p)ppGpp synthetase/guanosine-3',5'-bis(diphosphate) 3'-pyrophosphohydrolase [Oscillospiraceae bacterium]|nr:bifunctional (p)ppGpp synthetase/guanosine-3',5'-bis(diphosphate) 3'-pyrophosphohydrolase [Oscillospiraceae bacterium]
MIYTINTLFSKIINEEKQKYDLNRITAAYEFANQAHEGQTRSSGEPFISHPIAVACILLDLKMDTDTLVAALLHDVVEDTGVTLEMIKKNFGADVERLVDGVTKMEQIPLNYTKEEQHAENVRKILMNVAQDIRVMLIKLADRLHNMSTLEHRPSEKQLENALETMSVYAPIAHRLGMNSLKEQMEDLSLRYLDPYAYNSIENQIKHRREKSDAFINRTKEMISDRIGNMKPDPVIIGRVKGKYSIYKKVYIDGKNFDEIYDIYAIRIIVQSVIECYNVLGVIHDMFRPIPGRFKDYIANPKPNRYQSLHTTVISKEGVIPFEVQIRTVDMHNTAEYGVAAHWKYKAGIAGKVKASEANRVEWIRHILEQQQEADDIQQITETIKTDLAPDDVYVFTPKGEIITLPLGSNVIDFAYAIHSEIGNKMTGAKVGGRMVNYEYKLVTGDIVEIMTTGNPAYGPNRNWLEIVKTNQAKVKIRAWFRRERRGENISQGKSSLERELKRSGIYYNESIIKKAADEFHYSNTDDFYAAIGYDGLHIARAILKIKDISEGVPEPSPVPLPKVDENIAKQQSKGVIVEGIDNCLIRFAQCCAPLPGDEIIGFITRGYGVSVHKKNCVNADSSKHPDRWIRVSWANHGSLYYRASLEIVAEDRNALLADISSVISENKLSISEFSGRTLKNSNACIYITMEIAGVEQLNTIMGKLKKIPGVIAVTRREIVN